MTGSARGRRGAGRGTSVVSLGDLARYRGYSFAWFAEAGLNLVAGHTLDSAARLGPQSVLRDLRDALRARQPTLSASRPIPCVGHDPRDLLCVDGALQILGDILGGGGQSDYTPPSLFSLDFLEHTRGFMGAARKKREALRLGGDVLALAVAGAYATHAYTTGAEGTWEYGYVWVRAPRLVAPAAYDVQRRVRRATRTLVGAGLGVASVVVGVAAELSAALVGVLRDVLENPAYFEYLRVSVAGRELVAKGFDSLDVTGLAKLLQRAGVGRALRRLTASLGRDQGELRRFFQLLSTGLIEYYIYRRPVHLYSVLRALTSPELEREGRQALGDEWPAVARRLLGLSRLVAW